MDDFDETIKDIKENLIARIQRQEQEIERLKEENKKYNKWIGSLNKDNHKLNNIIKEVREVLIDLFGTDDKDINNILEILDKEKV